MKEDKHKTLKRILKVLQIFIYVVLALFIFVVILQRVSNNRISFFNYRMFTVVSESMKPKYKIGDVLISKETEPSKIRVGDVISYLGTSGSFEGKIITHQVTEINKTSDGTYMFHAKGLSNIIEDPIINENQLYGVVVYKTKVLSLIYKIVATKVGFLLFIVIPIIFTIFSEMFEKLTEKKEQLKNQKEE